MVPKNAPAHAPHQWAMTSHKGLECSFFPLGDKAFEELHVGQIRCQIGTNLLDNLAYPTVCHRHSLGVGLLIYFPREVRFIHFLSFYWERIQGCSAEFGDRRSSFTAT